MKKAENHRFRIEDHVILYEVLCTTADSKNNSWVQAQYASEYAPQLLLNPIIYLNDLSVILPGTRGDESTEMIEEAQGALEDVGIPTAIAEQIICALTQGASLTIEFGITVVSEDGRWKDVRTQNHQIHF